MITEALRMSSPEESVQRQTEGGPSPGPSGISKSETEGGDEKAKKIPRKEMSGREGGRSDVGY